MTIKLFVQCGIKGHPEEREEGIPINDGTIGNTSEWAGSFHILSMGRQYRSYVSESFPNYNPREELLPLDNFLTLSRKNPSQQVIGNFGECIGAIFARGRLGTPIKRIVPLITNRSIKRPDFMMNLEGSNIRNEFIDVIPAGQFPHLESLNWWPVEAKASSGQGAPAQKLRALTQLLSFWKNERENLRLSVGYGLILTYVYKEPVRKVIASIILPRDPANLYRELGMNHTDQELFQTTRGFLYDCGG